VACVACSEDPVGVFDIIFAGANDSGPKIPVESTKVAADCVTQFGPYALGAKVRFNMITSIITSFKLPFFEATNKE